MKSFCVVGMFFALILLGYGDGYALEKNEPLVPTVTLNLVGVKVDEVIKDVGKQVDYTIQVEGQLADIIVSGRYTDVSLDQFFHRVFRNKNIVVDMDTRKKVVVVYLFGSNPKKGFATVHGKNDSPSKLPLSNVNLAELDKILTKEEQLHQKLREDPNAIMPFTDISRAEFDKIVDQEAKKEQEQQQDPYRKIALSDVTHAEAGLILKQEEEKALATQQDPNARIALSDMTLSEYKIRLEDEEQRHQQMKNDPEERIPFSDVTYSEFHTMVSK